jgi:hypothetical protein
VLALFGVSFAACQSDDTDMDDVIAQYLVNPMEVELDFSDLTEAPDVPVTDENDSTYNDYVENSPWNKVISIALDGENATVSGSVPGVAIQRDGAHLTIMNMSGPVKFVVSGTTANGSLKFYGDKRFQVELNGADITNPSGAAINNQGSKTMYLVLADGTVNHLQDGTTYTMVDEEDQKAALFSEGQIIFSGSGTLNVTAVGRGGIRSDDYIRIRPGVKMYVNTSALDGLRANDGIIVDGGVVNIEATGVGAKGVRSGGEMIVNGGRMIALSHGDTRSGLDDDGLMDTASCAALYCDTLLTVNAGVLKFKATGDGGKGLNSKGDVNFRGGSLVAVATGTRKVKKPKGVKLDGSLAVSGGFFYSYSKRSDPLELGGKLEVATGYRTWDMGPKAITIAF